jgi:hypothetical protein
MSRAIKVITRLRPMATQIIPPQAKLLVFKPPTIINQVSGYRMQANLTRMFSDSAKKEKKAKKDDPNFFLDNLGKIFLGTIAVVIGALVRSSYNTSNRNNVRDVLEDQAVLDPVEIDELRIANSELTPEVFRKISKDLHDQFPHGHCSYDGFIKAVRRTMVQLKGGAFTIELGHIIDRVVSEILLKQKKTEHEEFPLGLWLVTLTLALNSNATDRIRILYEIMELKEKPVKFQQIPILAGYLQDTCQLPPDTQVVPTETAYPTQQWEKGTPHQLVPWEGSESETIDLDTLASILRSKSVCAWGECYHKKQFEPGT